MAEGSPVRIGGVRGFLALFPWARALITFLAGLAILVAMRIPVVEQSFLGEPDRAMRQVAFKLRSDVFAGAGDPVLLLNIDDASLRDPAYQPIPVGRQPTGVTSRAMLADLLTYIRSAPPANAPKAVIMDVDIGAPSSDPLAITKLHDALAAWGADTSAPTLIIAREAFPADLLGLKAVDDTPILPSTDYDDVIARAQNIYWGTTKMLSDNDNVSREILPLQCVRDGGTVVPLFNASIQAYGAMMRGAVPPDSPAAKWMKAGPALCSGPKPQVITHGEMINFHMSFKSDTPTWQHLRKDWPGYRDCKSETDSPVLSVIPASPVAQAGAGASTDILCHRLVIIGGTNHIAYDYQQSPLDFMPGPVILANATRGLQIADGGVRPLSFPFQAGVLALFSLTLTFSFMFNRRAREFYHGRKKVRTTSLQRLALVSANPVVLNFLLSVGAHYGGAALLIWGLSLGHWGFLSGPAFGAAIAETIQDFTE